MSNIKQQAYILIVIIQILFIGFLVFTILKKYFLKKPAINPFKKEWLAFNQSNSLQYFYEPRPNTIDNVNDWVPYKGIYTINADSLNERFDYAPEKNPSTYRIITLGDSFTYGMYVDTKDNWTELLEDTLNNKMKCRNISKFDVINLGVGGYEIQYGIERYKARGQKYDPDLVIWFLKDDDFQEILEIMLPKELKVQKQMKESGEFDKQVKQGNFYPSWEIARNQIIKEIGLKNILKKQKDFLQQFEKYFKNSLLFITFEFTNPEYKEVLRKITLDRAQTYFFDKIPNLYKIPDAAFFSDPHATKKGNRIIMEDVYGYLKKTRIIPCN